MHIQRDLSLTAEKKKDKLISQSAMQFKFFKCFVFI